MTRRRNGNLTISYEVAFSVMNPDPKQVGASLPVVYLNGVQLHAPDYLISNPVVTFTEAPNAERDRRVSIALVISWVIPVAFAVGWLVRSYVHWLKP